MKIFNHRFIISLAILALLCASAPKAIAQKGEIGFRFMPTISSFDINSSEGGKVNSEITFGWGAGILMAYNFNEHIGIQGEVIYNELSQKYAEDNDEGEVRLRYVNVPLLLSLNTGKTKPVNFNFVIGPQIGLNVGSRLFTKDTNGGNSNAVLSIKKGDLGVAYGAGASIGLTSDQRFRIDLGFRGVYGLVDISDDSHNLEEDSYFLIDRSHIETYSAYLGLSYLF